MKKVLIVDDEPILRELVRLTMEDLDVLCLEAEDGREALRLAREERPDLVLLDRMMPDADGLEVARELKSRTETEGIPVFLLTARGRPADLAAAAELPIEALIVKPFSPGDLLRQVEAVLGR